MVALMFTEIVALFGHLLNSHVNLKMHLICYVGQAKTLAVFKVFLTLMICLLLLSNMDDSQQQAT